jgi:hypothetical protein
VTHVSVLASLEISLGNICGQNDPMRPLHFHAIGLVSAAALLTVGPALAGCSSSSSTPPSHSTSATAPSSPPATSSSEPSSGAGADQAIETNWAKFFNAKTPVPQRIALLQNGSVFAPVIRAQAGSSLAKLATAKVTHVTLTGTNQASVVYSILVGGSSKAGLPGQTGVAVYQDGVWKVGDTSFCGLLKLENGGSSKGLFAGCKGL